MGEVFQDVGTGKSKFVAHEETETCKYAILGSTSVIGYDDSFDYEGDFILTARVGANAGTMYRHRGQVKISDNTVYLKGDNLDYMQALLTNFDLTKLSFGTGQPLIKSSELQRVDIFVSTSEEQQKLGNFFRTLDSSIAMQKRKCEGLRKLKAAYLQQMFPQSGESVPWLRFEGFTGAWHEVKIGDVADFNPRSTLPNSFEYIDLESVVGTSLISHRTENRETAPSRAQRLAKQGDVFFQTVRPYQMNNYLFELPFDNFVFSTGYAQLRPKVDSYFMLCKLQEKNFVAKVLDRCTGTSYPAINSTDLAEIEIWIASDEAERTVIGNFFRNFDGQIATQLQKLQQLQKLKSAYLQKMFV